MISFKRNVIVVFTGYNLVILAKAEAILGHAYVTSGADGTHGENSLHYQNKALDFGIGFIPPLEVNIAVINLKAAFGPDYDVILEGDHIHIEYDPKQRRGI